MKYILTSSDHAMHLAWLRHCSHLSDVQIVESLPEADAVMVPITSFGDFVEQNSIQALERFGPDIRDKIRQTIEREFDGELLVGQGILANTKDCYVIAVATRRVAGILPHDTVNPYLATRAAIQCARRANEVLSTYSGDPRARPIRTLALCEVQDVHPRRCAWQVAKAIQSMGSFPDTSEEASSWHDSLLAEEA